MVPFFSLFFWYYLFTDVYAETTLKCPMGTDCVEDDQITAMEIAFATKLELHMNGILHFVKSVFSHWGFKVFHTFQTEMTIFELNFSVHQKQSTYS